MAAIQLEARERAAVTIKFGTTEVACPAGRSLTIETAPGGEELLNEVCPAGKGWVVRVSVEIIETDL